MSVPAPVPGRWWHREDDRVVCDLCPRRCHLRPGQRGFCFVREATDEGMVLTTWGRSSGFCIDPIEKKPLHHVLPGTPVLSFGTAGCNLGCRFCQNWEISTARSLDARMDVATPRAIAEAAVRTGCRAVAATYNDPVIFAEYALDVAEAVRAAGLRMVGVTAGYVTTEARAEVMAAFDAVNVDLKAFTDTFYRRQCYGRLDPVRETLRWLVHHTDVHVEITTLVIPGLNDGDEELEALATWVAEDLSPDVPLHFTAYHPDHRLGQPPTPPATLRRARARARAAGMRFVYTGNAVDPQGESTWCPGCGALLIERRGYRLGHWGLVDGACGTCGEAIPGVFEARPGTWGARRQPVRIGAPSGGR